MGSSDGLSVSDLALESLSNNNGDKNGKNNGVFALDVIAAILVSPHERILINFFC